MTVTQRMPRSARRALIAALIEQAGAVTTDEVATQLGISWMTVRRDFEALQRDGLANRTHGGAVLPSRTAAGDGPPPASEDQLRVAQAAAALIGDGETVALDASPCNTAVAQALLGRRVTVITNALGVMQAIARGGEATRLIGLCGRLDPHGAFIGPSVLAAAREHFADRLLLGADTLTEDGRLLDDDAAGADVKRVLVAQADQVVLLAADGPGSGTAGALVAHAADLTYAIAAGAATAA